MVIFLIFLFFGAATAHADVSSEAEALFKRYSPAIYQVQSLSSQSNKKYSIGSGFQISKEGYVVTNYHVVSDAVMFPSSFHIQALQSDGKAQPAHVVAVDVIHDLAVLQIKSPQDIELPLGSSEISKGKKLFSIGNPEDVGMMIIEGVANGYMDKALYRKVLTSLPLNPGMSGGPTLDAEGHVIGINVMTAGNSLSFLVPVECLKDLWGSITANKSKPAGDFPARIQSQLISQEHEYFGNVLSGKWEKQRLGRFVVPTAISNEMTCWGEPGDNVEYWIESPYVQCEIKDDLFIASSVRAHTISFNYSWLKSREYDPYRFFSLANQRLSKYYRFELDGVYERDAENFECRTDTVEIAGNPFWVSTCARKLKKLTKLYDINVRMASLGDTTTMLMVELTLGAVTKETAKAFIGRFYREIEWVK